MAPSVETMSLPYQSNKSLLDAVAAAAASAEQLPTNNGESATTTVATSGNKTSSTSAAANNTKTYTTPKRPAGTAQVTPGTCSKEDGGDGGNNSNNSVEEQNNSTDGGEQAIVSASSTDETAADSRSSSPNKSMPPPPAVSGGQAASASSVQVASAQKISKISSSVVVAPSIQLGPRVTPAVRKNPPPQSCMKPRSLEGVLEKGVGERTTITTAQFQLQKSTTGGRSSATSKKKVPSATLSIAQQVAALDGGGIGQTVKQEGPSTPSGQKQSNLPAPSSFLAAKISPLRSSARRNGEKNKGETANNGTVTASSDAGMTLKREGTPPPAASDDVSIIFILSSCLSVFFLIGGRKLTIYYFVCFNAYLQYIAASQAFSWNVPIPSHAPSPRSTPSCT